jgi:hypothetical protein
MSMIRTVLATLLVLGSASLAYAAPGAAGSPNGHIRAHSLVSRDVALLRQTGPSAAEAAWLDRASQSFGGG